MARSGRWLGILLIGCGVGRAPQTGAVDDGRDRGRVARENALPGDPSWRLDAPADAHQVEGYAARATVEPGGAIGIKVNVDVAKFVEWRAFRLGWYGGAGARLIDRSVVEVQPQPPCARAPLTARVECAWATAFSVEIPADALAGVYLVQLRADRDAYVPFVVTDGRVADLVVSVPFASWQAENDWGGESLDSDDSGRMPSGRAFEVSFDRPFARDTGAGGLFSGPLQSIRFIEALGYDATYATATEIERYRTLDGARAFVSVGDDPYWTVAEREAVERARDQGKNLAFFGAAQSVWRARLQPSSSGAPDRVLACYKDDQARDPLATGGDLMATTRFRDPPSAQPENALVGVRFGAIALVAQPLAILDETSWALDGTGLHNGDPLPFALAARADARAPDGEPRGLQAIASAAFVDGDAAPARAATTWYVAPSGAETFAAGTGSWAAALDGAARDARIARITRNVLDRFIGDGRKGGDDPAGAPWTQAAAAPALVVEPARAETIAGAADGRFPSDGPGASAGFLGPAGLAVADDGALFVSDAPGNAIRRIAADGARTVTTWAGDGVAGALDGPGASARFRSPTALALAPDGALWVADTGNHAIRRVAPDGAHTVTTYAGIPGTAAMVNGPGASALFDHPCGLAADAAGVLLVADFGNHQIRRVAADGARSVSTVAGSTRGFRDGDALDARLSSPSAIAFSPDGAAWILDSGNRAIRRFAGGVVSTVIAPRSTDVAPPTDGPTQSATVAAQAGLAWSNGALYFADLGAGRVRRLSFSGGGAVSSLAGPSAPASVGGDREVTTLAPRFATPMAIAPSGTSLYVADAGATTVSLVTVP